MDELELLIAEVETDLSIGRFDSLLPRFLELTTDNVSERIRIYCIASRCYYAASDRNKCEEMLDIARDIAEEDSIEGRVHIALTEASILNTDYNPSESEVKLDLALSNLDRITVPMRARALSIHGRNEALVGAFSEAIEYSQEAIHLKPETGTSTPFAYGTLAFVFQAMGRYPEAEEFGLQQIELLAARGSKHSIAGLYSFLGSGAAAHQNWEKAKHYHELAVRTLGDVPETSSIRPVLVCWQAEAQMQLGNNSRALEFAEEALRLAEKITNPVFVLNAQVLLGRVQFKNHNYQESRSMFLNALASEQLLGDAHQVQLFEGLTNTYLALEQKSDAFEYCYKLWQLQTDFDNRTREALLRYHKALEQKIHKQQTALLEMKAAHLERELSLQAINMAAQTELLARFRDDLRRVVREVNEPLLALRQVKEKLKDLPCEQIDWTKFEAQFTEAHPEFGAKLHEKFPDLSPAEVRLCKLLRLDLKSAEIARLFCLSERTIETQRLAVRRKLGLKRNQSVADALAEFTPFRE